MDLLTVTQAAEATGRYRDTIRSAVRKGRLPSTKREGDNALLVSPTDLFKLYPPMPKNNTAELRRDRDAWREHANTLLTMIQKPTNNNNILT